MLKLLGLVLAWAGFAKLQPAYAPARRVAGIALAVAFLASGLQAQIPDSQLKTMGLHAMWQAQLDMPLQAGSIVSVNLWTDPTVKKVYAELTLPVGSNVSNRTLRTPARLGEDGTTWLIDEAKKDVQTRAARILGRAPGTPAVEVTVPLVQLVVVTSDGVVQTYDAETGEKLWQNTCGSVSHPAAPAAIGDIGVVVAQGDTLFLLDWKTGEHLQRRRLERATSAGVALVGTVAFTSSQSGQVQGFDLTNPESSPYTFRLYGRCISPPVSSDRAHHVAAFATSVSVATLLSAGDKRNEKIGPWFNVTAREPISGPLTFIGGSLYLGDSGGQVSKIGIDRMGKVEWRMMIGDGLGAPPVLVGKTIFATNEVGYLHAADDTTGYPVWSKPTPRVKSILAANKDHLYCRSLTDRLMIVDTQTGRILSQTGESRIGYSVINHLNDRLYLISAGGLLQCARELGANYVQPVFHEPLPAATEETNSKPAEAPAAEEGAPAAGDDNPFGAEAMEPAEAADPADPFASPTP